MIKNTVDLSTIHANDLALVRQLVTTLISSLEKEIITPIVGAPYQKNNNKPVSTTALLWGEKENAVSTLVKLTGLLLKVIPLEQQLAGNCSFVAEEELSYEDNEILSRYLSRVTNCSPESSVKG